MESESEEAQTAALRRRLDLASTLWSAEKDALKLLFSEVCM